jgi:hypothetical protein
MALARMMQCIEAMVGGTPSLQRCDTELFKVSTMITLGMVNHACFGTTLSFTMGH